MNYEDFYKNAQALEKNLGEKLQNMQKTFKNIIKYSGKGD